MIFYQKNHHLFIQSPSFVVRVLESSLGIDRTAIAKPFDTRSGLAPCTSREASRNSLNI